MQIDEIIDIKYAFAADISTNLDVNNCIKEKMSAQDYLHTADISDFTTSWCANFATSFFLKYPMALNYSIFEIDGLKTRGWVGGRYGLWDASVSPDYLDNLSCHRMFRDAGCSTGARVN